MEKRAYINEWKMLCEPKEDGGLSFRSFGNFNIALIAKVLKAKYYPTSSFIQSNLQSVSSYT